MQLKIIDLFAGCGGLSLGLTQAGHRIVAACEIDEWASTTYEESHPGVAVLRRDIRSLSGSYVEREFRGEVNCVVGGPPCQGFSVSGKRQYGIFLEHNDRVRDYLRIVAAIRPQILLMENVGGFRTAKINPKTSALAFIRDYFKHLGYHVYSAILQAADFGVPQCRTRIFVIGSMFELLGSPFPSQTHSKTPSNELLRPHLSVEAAISDLPPIAAGEGADGFQPYIQQARNSFQRDMRRGSSGVFNHQAMRHSERLVKRFSTIPPGGSGYELGRSRPGSQTGIVTHYKMNNQRLVADLPSLCITANFQSNYIHPTFNRNLTAREAARIMTFPDTFVLRGKRTLMSSSLLKAEGRHDENHLSQYNQLGNAVPPMLARLIGDRLGEVTEMKYRRVFDLKSRPLQAGLFR